MTKLKLAILDDYQGTAKDLADWSRLPPGTNVQFFQDHLSDEDKLRARLAAAEDDFVSSFVKTAARAFADIALNLLENFQRVSGSSAGGRSR